MKILRTSQLLALFFFTCVGSYFVYFNVSKPRVLVLQSYLDDYSWSRDIDTGIRRSLKNPTAYTVRWHYMDLKRHTDKEFRTRAANSALKVIENWKPDVILAVDDNAHEYVAKYFINRPGVSIVHAGINGETAPYGYDKAKNVTGILERKPLDAIKEAMIELALLQGKNPKNIRIINIGDRSESLVNDEKFLLEYDWSPLKLVDSKLVKTFDEWKKVVAGAESRADFIVLSNYRQLTAKPGEKQFVPPKVVMEWTEKNSKPVILGMQGFNVEDGASIAIGVSPYEQGEVSGEMAAAIVAGKKPKDIPEASTRQYVVYMSDSKLKARNLSVPKIYEAFARASNTYLP